jgi:hypothetical protein
MKTEFMLMAQYGRPFPLLDDVARDYLMMDSATAKRRAATQGLPLPVTRLGSQKGPWVVSIEDLAKYLDERMKQGREDFRRMAG